MAHHGRMFSVPLAALIALTFAPTAAHAYGGLTHEYLATEAAKVFSFPALDAHLASVNAEDEDSVDHIYGHWIATATHFWDADDSDLHHTYYVATVGYCANAYMKADSRSRGSVGVNDL